ncbi:MAG: FAD-binding oxidoreductase [Anaerolineales bacterium]|nr:FAD-binding oxidoreductase [Anaerolineales bacterium]
MTTTTADIIIIGGGINGASTAFNLANLGAKNVVLLERNDVCSGGTAKSCAICRTHYSIEPNRLHAVESLKIFENFQDVVGGSAGFHRTGYIILGPESHRAPMLDVFKAQNALGIDTAVLSKAEAQKIHPLLNLDDIEVIGYDTRAGYCDPHLATNTYVSRAKELGVNIRTSTPVTKVEVVGNIKRLHTPHGIFETPTLVVIAGPWTNSLTEQIGVKFPYEISRHKVITLKINQPYDIDWPTVKDLTTADKIYFRPETGGVVLVGTGDHGDPIEDADTLLDNQVNMEHVEHISSLIAHRMPAFQNSQYTAGWTGPYDITPDWNPILGAVPGHEGVFVGVGFSGHGFKMAPTVGESLAQTVLDLPVRVSIEAYSPSRFAEGKALHGAYGIGSIS